MTDFATLAQRTQLLTEWASRLDQAARGGALSSDGKPISIQAVDCITGPRAGVLHIDAGLDAARLVRAMTEAGGAIMRQFITWSFVGEPACYLTNRFVRLEAGWPPDLAERKIKVSDLGAHPHESGQWVAGKNEHGATVILSLTDLHPHFLIAGTTGSGKSWALRSLAVQLSHHGDLLMLVDGKMSEGLRHLDKLPGVVGPLATEIDQARSALTWAVAEMVDRYQNQDYKRNRLIIIIDEVQELIGDPTIVESIRRLAAQGRAVKVHLIIATQHPVNRALGDPTIKRNVSGRLALLVADAKSSEVAVGQATPRADWLLGEGDAYAVVPGATHRIQVAYITLKEIEPILNNTPLLETWPPLQLGAVEKAGNIGSFSGAELAVGLVNAHNEGGRPALVHSLEAARAGKPGSERAQRLLALSRAQLQAMRESGWMLCPVNRSTARVVEAESVEGGEEEP